MPCTVLGLFAALKGLGPGPQALKGLVGTYRPYKTLNALTGPIGLNQVLARPLKGLYTPLKGIKRPLKNL